MDSVILEKISKVKELAERGVGGEKINAEILLAKLLAKYDIQEEDLLDEVIKEYEFYCHGKLFGTDLFGQIVHSVNPERQIFYYSNKRSDCKTRFVKCTQSEFIEISEMYNFYMHHFEEGLRTYYKAFIQAERIFPDYNKYPELLKGSGTLTEEDKKMLRLAGNMDKHERYLMLED